MPFSRSAHGEIEKTIEPFGAEFGLRAFKSEHARSTLLARRGSMQSLLHERRIEPLL